MRLGHPDIAALAAGGADPFRRFELDQLLQHQTNCVTDQVHTLTGGERRQQLAQGRLGNAISEVYFGGYLAVRTDDLADGRYLTEAAPDDPKPHHALDAPQGCNACDAELGVLRRRLDIVDWSGSSILSAIAPATRRGLR